LHVVKITDVCGGSGSSVVNIVDCTDTVGWPRSQSAILTSDGRESKSACAAFFRASGREERTVAMTLRRGTRNCVTQLCRTRLEPLAS
jgi:hypothetical protein